MVPFSQPLLLACRKLAAKLMASMRFEGRVFLSEIGWPEHEYSDLIKLFGKQRVAKPSTCRFHCTFSVLSASMHLHVIMFVAQMYRSKRDARGCACLISMNMRILLTAQLVPS